MPDPSGKKISEKLAAVNAVFTPSAPVTIREFFQGRLSHLEAIGRAIGERGGHAVLYGDRGVGKTSLANIARLFFRSPEMVVVNVTCDSDNSFKDIWKNVCRRISLIVSNKKIGYLENVDEQPLQLEFWLPEDEEIDSGDVLAVFKRIRANVVVILDEFDQVRNLETNRKIASTIKALSDSCANVTMIIVGVGTNVGGLVRDHASIERCLTQIELPKMTDLEIAQIIDVGFKNLEMTIAETVRERVIQFSDGYPHFTHLLAQECARAALSRGSLEVEEFHFSLAVDEAIERSQESLREAYHRATATTQTGTRFRDVLYACALVEVDEQESFRASDLAQPLKEDLGLDIKTTGYTYHLGKLCDDERGTVLRRIPAGRRYRFAFSNAMMRAYVKLRVYSALQSRLV